MLDARQHKCRAFSVSKGGALEVIKHYVGMTTKQIDTTAEALAVIIVAHIKANRKRAAEAKRNDQFNQPNQNTDDRPEGAISDD